MPEPDLRTNHVCLEGNNAIYFWVNWSLISINLLVGGIFVRSGRCPTTRNKTGCRPTTRNKGISLILYRCKSSLGLYSSLVRLVIGPKSTAFLIHSEGSLQAEPEKADPVIPIFTSLLRCVPELSSFIRIRCRIIASNGQGSLIECLAPHINVL